jgi:hypothetical protein
MLAPAAERARSADHEGVGTLPWVDRPVVEIGQSDRESRVAIGATASH